MSGLPIAASQFSVPIVRTGPNAQYEVYSGQTATAEGRLQPQTRSHRVRPTAHLENQMERGPDTMRHVTTPSPRPCGLATPCRTRLGAVHNPRAKRGRVRVGRHTAGTAQPAHIMPARDRMPSQPRRRNNFWPIVFGCGGGATDQAWITDRTLHGQSGTHFCAVCQLNVHSGPDAQYECTRNRATAEGTFDRGRDPTGHGVRQNELAPRPDATSRLHAHDTTFHTTAD